MSSFFFSSQKKSCISSDYHSHPKNVLLFGKGGQFKVKRGSFTRLLKQPWQEKSLIRSKAVHLLCSYASLI